jgi:hypothetical protein
LAWNVEPCALSVPVAHAAAAAGAEAAGALDVDAAAADVVAAAGAEVDADVLDFELLLLFVPHAAAASNAPAVSRVAAMREVLKG